MPGPALRKNKNADFFWALDGLRGIAAICIVLYHYCLRFNLAENDVSKRFLPDMFLGVDFFFMMSGFVIAHAYQSRLEKGYGVGAFMRGRFIRLYPLYFFAITLSFLLFIATLITGCADHSGKNTAISYLLHLAFLPTPPQLMPIGWGAFPLDAAAWSLSLEIWINLIYPLCFQWLSPKRLLKIMGLLAIGLCWANIHYGTLSVGTMWSNYIGGWIRISYSFFAGLLLYGCYTRFHFPKLPAWLIIPLGVALLAIFSLPDSLYINLTIIFMVWPLVIWLGAHISLSGAIRNLAGWLGKISYALYIIHYVLYHIFAHIFAVLGRDPTAHLHITIALMTAIAVLSAWLLDEVYDIPVRNWLKNNWVPRKASLTASALPAL